jgi:glycyl-tRNA synthetase beta chain
VSAAAAGPVAELFVEIGCEELPAGFIAPLRSQLEELMVTALDRLHLTHGARRTFATPRRLAISVLAVSLRQPDAVERKLGPPKRAAYDEAGALTPTALGFCRGQGIDPAALQTFETPKGEYIGFERAVPGRTAAEVLPEALGELFGKLTFKKSMRWGDRPERFARPVRWLVCLFAGNVLPVSFGEVAAGRTTRGHRFLSPEPFAVSGRLDYILGLRERRVLADVDERRAAVQEGLQHALRHLDLGVRAPRIVEDAALVAEVTNLVEWPVTVVGSFEAAYLDLPREVIVAAMRGHQRYFAVEDAEASEATLVNRFLTVAGTEVRSLAVVRAGNERVLRSRLADARFFWDEDRKRPLASRAEALKGVTFQAKLGSYFEKQERVAALARALAAEVVAQGYGDAAQVADHAARAAALCKCDLVTGLVREFPELQGVLGGYYARHDGEPDDVAHAVAEHYLPRAEDDPLPPTRAGAALALADKLDSIVQLWSAGLKPTGTKDPYAIRQAAVGVLRILFGRGMKTSLARWVRAAAPSPADSPAGALDGLVTDVVDYFVERQRALFVRDGAPADVVDAVVALGHDDPVGNRGRVEALFQMVHDAEFVPFFDLAKRVRKIAPHERRVAAGGGYEYPGLADVDEARLVHPLEKALWEAFCQVEGEARAAAAAGDWLGVLRLQKRLIRPVDEFFNAGPKVLAPEEDLRQNRTVLCAQLDRFLCTVADLSCVTGAAVARDEAAAAAAAAAPPQEGRAP